MRAFADDAAFIQHDDLFGISDGGDALGHKDQRAVRRFLLEGAAQGASVLKSSAEKLSSRI